MENTAIDFDALKKEFTEEMVRFANQLIQDEEEAKKIVEQTYRKLDEMQDRFTTKNDVKAFLFITVRNSCLSHLRLLQLDKGF